MTQPTARIWHIEVSGRTGKVHGSTVICNRAMPLTEFERDMELRFGPERVRRVEPYRAE